MTSTEIAVRDNAAVAERDIIDGWVAMASDVFKLAAHICETDFVPDAYRGNAPAVAAAILTGRELGIGPMTSLRHVQLVKNSPSLSAEYKRARVLAAGHDLDIIELNTTRCKVVGRRRGKPPLEITFSIEDARRAGLLAPSRSGKPGAWQTRPRRMLFARASTEVCDFMFTDITNGLPTTELLMEGTEDSFEGYAESPAQLPPSTPGEPPKAAPRTARRRQAAPDTSPAQAAPPPAAPAQPPVPQGAGEALPPLPGDDEDPTTSGASSSAHAPDSGSQPKTGEQSPSTPDGFASTPDDTGYDTPGTVAPTQITAIWTVLNQVYGFTKDEKEQARVVCGVIAGCELASTKDLSKNQAKAILDTLGHWQHQAGEKGERPRDYLIAMLAAQEETSSA